ncbi:MAG: ABC transporter permease, partial [Verrucomicrobia bacterium]|nr:ABC transporter permease [Verrucomicrobiota bacterium]
LGLTVGWFNSLIVNHLRIPPIIATLATGYILTTATLLFNRGFRTYAISQFLSLISSGHLGPIPILLILAAVLTFVIIWLLHGTAYGRCLAAVGQNAASAELSGIHVDRIKQAAYMLSGLLAALGGVFLSGRVSGAFLEMGNPFLLQSVGAVVVGGSSILGGRATAFGTLLGSIFLVMIVTTMQVLHLAGGFQDVAQGILIIFVLAVATVKRR